MLLCMSTYDILESICNFMSTWPIPKEGSGDDQVWATGTTATCSLQGFVLTLSVAVPMYNGFLALYYMLVINHNVSDRTLRNVVEPCVHGITFLWSFGTAVSSVSLSLINDANLWCWIAPLPADCKDSWTYGDEGNCQRGDNAWIYRWAFYFAPLWFCIFLASTCSEMLLWFSSLAAAICTLLVFHRVRRLDERTLKYRQPLGASARIQRQSSRNSLFRRTPSGRLANSFRSLGSGSESRSSDKRRLSVTRMLSSRFFNLTEEENKDDEFLSGLMELSESTEGGFESDGVALGFFGRLLQRRNIYKEDYRRSVEVSSQAVFYLTAFYLTHVWSTSTRLTQQLRGGGPWFGLILVHSWFDPFQVCRLVSYFPSAYIHHRDSSTTSSTNDPDT